MITGYQKPNLKREDLGDNSREQILSLLREEDWITDLMEYASLSAQGKQACPPNFHAQIGGRIAVTIVPAGKGQFTVVASRSSWPKWLGCGKDVQIEKASVEDVGDCRNWPSWAASAIVV